MPLYTKRVTNQSQVLLFCGGVCYYSVYMKKAIFFIVLIVLVGVGVYMWGNQGQMDGSPQKNTEDPFNTTYMIEGASVTLNLGSAESEVAPGSASKLVTKVFGEPVYGDLDGDGDDDAAIFLTQDGGGSGTFYYAVAAINEDGAYKGTKAILLGDRIAPQTINIREGFLVANYADRKAGDEMTAQPSMGVSMYAALVNGDLVKIAPNGDKSDLIRVGVPSYLAHISSPLSISGEARGTWYFEASFPIVLTDLNGNVIAQHYAEAQSEWMTEDFVPFKATLEFKKPASTTKAILILKKDNPSGLPEHEDEIKVPVIL